MFLLLKYTLLYTVVLMMVALGGMFSERSGTAKRMVELSMSAKISISLPPSRRRAHACG